MKIYSTALIFSFFISINALAEEAKSNWYLGAGTLHSTTQKDGFLDEGGLHIGNLDYKGSKYGFKLIAGYEVSSWFALELNYLDYGITSDIFTPDPNIVTIEPIPTKYFYDSTAVSLVSKFNYGISHDLAVFLKAGLHYADEEVRYTPAPINNIPTFMSNKSTDVIYGLGFDYNFNKNLSTYIEYEAVKTELMDVSNYSLGLKYHF